MSNDVLDRPLSETEFDELDELLDVLSPEGKGMSLSEVDGFLTALMAGPFNVLPSEWMSRLWDPVDGLAGPVSSDERQLERFFHLLMTHMNSISRALREAPHTYAPLLLRVPAVEFCQTLPLADVTAGSANDDTLVWAPFDWCTGFLCGVEMDMGAWLPFMEENAEGFGLLVAFGSDEGLEKLASHPPTMAAVDEAVGVLGIIATQAHEFFRLLRDAGGRGWQPRQPHRRSQRVGRNEPCPCGSGRKFKHCHGGRGGLN